MRMCVQRRATVTTFFKHMHINVNIESTLVYICIMCLCFVSVCLSGGSELKYPLGLQYSLSYILYDREKNRSFAVITYSPFYYSNQIYCITIVHIYIILHKI